MNPQIQSHNPAPEDSSEPQPNIPDDIIIEILYRLPVKSLLKFRSVCKAWRSWISDPQFVKTHLSLSPVDCDHAHCRIMLSYIDTHHNLKSCSLHSLLYEKTTTAFDLDFPLKQPFKVVGSVNGLVLILIIAGEDDRSLLWNPSTRKSRKLPIYDKTEHGCLIPYGFGYDQSNDDYKMVGVCFTEAVDGSRETKVSLYTLRTDSWRRIQGFPRGIIPLNDLGKFANGALHWVASSATYPNSSYSWVIVYLDLARETYGEIAEPPSARGRRNDVLLGVLGGSLCAFCNFYGGSHAELWVMKEYGIRESWTKLVTINYWIWPVNCRYNLPLCISNNGEILLRFSSGFIIFNPKTGGARHPRIHDCFGAFGVHTYVESLVSPVADNMIQGEQH